MLGFLRNSFPLQVARVLFMLCACARGAGAQTTQTVEADAPQAAADKQLIGGSRFLRVERDKDGDPVALLTSVVTFRPTAVDDNNGAVQPAQVNPELQVDLIGAVHVADAKYFQELNRRFPQYDALLYELVAEPEANVPVNGQSRHPVGQLQQGLKSMLELQFQLEQVDYTQPNFVHADMSPQEFADTMQDRGESFLQMMLRMMGQAMAKQPSGGGAGDAKLFMALFSSDRPLLLKRIMAEQFEDMEGSTKAFASGPDQSSAIIHERNKKALKVLREQIAAGKKRIGIFYGAAHMPDMAKRLVEDFQLQPTNDEWLTAWEMHAR